MVIYKVFSEAMLLICHSDYELSYSYHIKGNLKKGRFLLNFMQML